MNNSVQLRKTVPGKLARKPDTIKDITMNTALINCRSLKKKLDSLVMNFEMLVTTVALLNETWFHKGDKILKKKLEEVEMSSGIKVIRKDRNSRGGCCIRFQVVKLPKAKAEIAYRDRF